MSKGCKLVLTDCIGGKILWGHPDGYFINAQGLKLAHDFNPGKQRGRTVKHPSAGGFTGSIYPMMRSYGNKACHLLMAFAFYGIRPTYMDIKTGKEYVGICHHIIPDKLDYRPANLLCWLTREQHTDADRRQRVLKKILPDMHEISYDEHRRLQDPRVTSKEQFEVELEKIRKRYGIQ